MSGRHGRRRACAAGDWASERKGRDRRVTSEYGMSAHYSCGRKARYPTKEDAIGMAAARVSRGPSFLRAYHCPYCGGWHLTSQADE